MIIALLLASSVQLAPNCQPISADRIYGRDLAAALPSFGRIRPDLEVSLAPIPGQQRMFHPNELRRLAEANGFNAPAQSAACFSWVLRTARSEELVDAMKKSLAGRNATIEVVEQSNAPVPSGEIVFPLSGLSGSSEGPVVWRGSVVYAQNKTISIWARVRISVKETHVATAELLHPGDEIYAEQLRLEPYEGPLTREHYYTSVKEVVGLTAKSTITPGSILTATLIRERKDIERGDLVRVVVQSGRTRLEAQGIAEEAGFRGALVTIRNARSGKNFRARVEEKGLVSVLPSGPTGLVPMEESKTW